ncbi:hypothetical protein EF888_10945 [Silicimonas algicola]|uniref:recombinase family protein n=1 Tax=Silicimonas algicola TaxID=1826607 RepID=UPI000D6BD394|nr:recombinase family protein [Silicimonas algicola]AZQ67602.1 hypothetical protein EF888_10945 [Silicimonas algicola]
MKLGNPNGAALLRGSGTGGYALREAVSANANAFAQALAPVLAVLQADRDMTLREVAADLNGRAIRTRRNGRWHVSKVRKLLARLRGGGRFNRAGKK